MNILGSILAKQYCNFYPGPLIILMVTTAPKFLDLILCPFAHLLTPLPLPLYLGIWAYVRTGNNSRLYITPGIDNR